VPSDFENLVRQHSARIRRIARRYAASGAVDDLVQDILVRLWRSYPSFRSTRAAMIAQSLTPATAPETTSMGEVLESCMTQ
jgi:DNA-directed RNA polymerase specialized sigma24 family protein